MIAAANFSRASWISSRRSKRIRSLPKPANPLSVLSTSETQADCMRRFRQKHSVPVLGALKEWLDKIAPKVVPDTKLSEAISYTLNQWKYLTRYTEDGRMPIDNNLLERDIRVFANGRKGWLFCDSVEGATASAVVYSLMLTFSPSAPTMPISRTCSPSTSPKPKTS